MALRRDLGCLLLEVFRGNISVKTLLWRRTSGLPCLARCHHDLTPYKRKKTDGWMDQSPIMCTDYRCPSFISTYNNMLFGDTMTVRLLQTNTCNHKKTLWVLSSKQRMPACLFSGCRRLCLHNHRPEISALSKTIFSYQTQSTQILKYRTVS